MKGDNFKRVVQLFSPYTNTRQPEFSNGNVSSSSEGAILKKMCRRFAHASLFQYDLMAIISHLITTSPKCTDKTHTTTNLGLVKIQRTTIYEPIPTAAPARPVKTNPYTHIWHAAQRPCGINQSTDLAMKYLRWEEGLHDDLQRGNGDATLHHANPLID